MITKVDRPIRAAQSGSSPCCRDQVSLARVSVRDAGLFAEDGGRGSGRGETDDLAAVLGPGRGEGAHGGGLPGPGRRDGQLQPGPGGAHLPDQGGLPGIQRGAVGGHLEQRQIHRRLVDDGAVAASGGRDQPLLGVEDPLGGVGLGAGDGVDRGAVDPPQHLRFLDAVIGRGQRHRSGVQHLIDQQLDQGVGALGGDVGGADLALGFGPDMPHLPGRAVFLHRRQHPVGRLGHPRGVHRLPCGGPG